ncbi:MAG: hypothetical protein AAF371_06330 [Pseudomonadota bacterium]
MSGGPRDKASKGRGPGHGQADRGASRGVGTAQDPGLALWFTAEAVVLMVRDGTGAWSERAEAPLDDAGQATGIAALHEKARLADPDAAAQPTVQLWLPEEHVIRLRIVLEEGLDAAGRLEAVIAAVVAQTEQAPRDLAIAVGAAAAEARARPVTAAFALTVREATAYAEGWGFRPVAITAAPGLDGSAPPAGPPASLTPVETLRARMIATPRDAKERIVAPPPAARAAGRGLPRMGSIAAAGVILALLAFFLGVGTGGLLWERDDLRVTGGNAASEGATEEAVVIDAVPADPVAGPDMATADDADGRVAAPRPAASPALPEPARPNGGLARLQPGFTLAAAAPISSGAAGSVGGETREALTEPAFREPVLLMAPLRPTSAAPPARGETFLPRPAFAPRVADAPPDGAAPPEPPAPPQTADVGQTAPGLDADIAALPPNAEGVSPRAEAPDPGPAIAAAAPDGRAVAPATVAPDAPGRLRALPELPPPAATASVGQGLAGGLGRPLGAPAIPQAGEGAAGRALAAIDSLSVVPPALPRRPQPVEQGGRRLDLTPTAAAPETMARMPLPRGGSAVAAGEDTTSTAVATAEAADAVPLPPAQPPGETAESGADGLAAAAATAVADDTALAVPDGDDALAPTTLAALAAPAPRQRPTDVPPRMRGNLVRLGDGSDRRQDAGPRVARPSRSTPATTPLTISTRLPARVGRSADEGSLALSEMTLIGVLELETGRQALLRMPNGRYQRLGIGDRVEGWQITAIGGESVRIQREGSERILALVAR